MLNNLYILSFLAIVKHWRLKPLQLILMLIGLTTATALWNSVQLINAEAKKAYSDAKAISIMSTEKILVDKTGLNFHDSYFGELRRKGWPVTPRVQGLLENALEAENAPIMIIGLDPLSAYQRSTAQSTSIALSPDEFMQGVRIILAGPNTAKKLSKLIDFQNVTISKNLPERYAIMDISMAQEILKLKSKLTSLHLTGPIPLDLSDIESRGLKIKITENTGDLDNLTNSFHLNLTAFGFLSYLVGLFIVYSTVNLAFEQRKGILKGLRSIGLSSWSIASLMLLEILLISFFSGLFGLLISYTIASTLLPDVAITLNGLFGANLENNLTLSNSIWITSFIVSTVGAICSSGPSLIKSLKLSPIESAKKIAWFEETRSNLKYQLIITCVSLGLIIYLLIYGSGIMQAFLLLGATLVSATLLLPFFLWLSLSLTLRYQFQSPLLGWFLSDCKQQINSLSVSLMALLLALAINIGVGGMVESFRKTFNGWLDQRLASELYIRTSNESISTQMIETLGNKVIAILPIVKVPQKIGNTQVDIYGFSPHETYENHWPLLSKKDNVWRLIEMQEGILINEQLSRRLGLKINDPIEFKSKKGVTIEMEVSGIYSDYGNPKGQLMLPLNLFNQYFPDEPELNFAIRVAPASITQIIDNLTENISREDITVTDQNEIKNLSLKIFEKTFAITDSLSILTFGIAGMALFTSITTLGSNRYSQLAPVWSIGTKRRTLAIFEALRSASLSILTFIFAIPVGLLVVLILTNYVNVEAFDWKLPIFLFPNQWLLLGTMTIVITFIATILHSLRLATASPAELLKASQYDT